MHAHRELGISVRHTSRRGFTRHNTFGFTLIEVLVVVAIIALLISILLPSLKRARDQARATVCQTNIRSLMTAFLTYASETKGFLPGLSEDHEADWLGLGNTNPFTKQAYSGRNPEDGKIFKYMGKQKAAYRCPDDNQYRQDASGGYGTTGNRNYSYTTCTLLSGANTANVGQSHYRLGAATDTNNYSDIDHTANMRVSVAFVIVEEDYDFRLKDFNNSAWDNDDSVTDRHPGKRGNVSCIDGHVQSVSLPPYRSGLPTYKWFGSMRQCIKYRSRWVSGKSWGDFCWKSGENRGAYRYIERAKSAKDIGVRHVGGG